VAGDPDKGIAMNTTEATYAASPPALDPFGGPHFTADYDDPAPSSPVWTGDPSSVPLPAEVDRDHPFDAGAELDRIIFAALIAP
jgi:hypothetical protein